MTDIERPDDMKAASFEYVERAQLLAWVGLSADAKIDFFEEMVELAYRSGALTRERLALRDRIAREFPSHHHP